MIVSMLLCLVQQFTSHKFTFTNKHLSTIKLKEKYWKDNEKLTLHFISNGKDGVVLTAKNIYQELLELKIVNHHLVVSFNTHPVNVGGFHMVKIEEGKWYKIKMKEEKSGIKLMINNIATLLPMYRQRQWLMENWQEVHIGGMGTSKNVETEDNIHDNVHSESFIGCVNFPLKGDIKNVIDESSAVANGCVDACSVQSCENGGRCINKYEYAYCDCKGTGYEGQSCEIESEAITFDGRSFIKYASTKRLSHSDDITLRFKTISEDGIILSTSCGKNDVLVELHQGVLNVFVRLPHGVFHLSLGKNLNDNLWHRVTLTRNQQNVQLHLDEQTIAKAFISDELSEILTTNQGIEKGVERGVEIAYFGGVLDVKDTPYSLSKNNFQGCLQHLYHNTHDAVRKILHATDKRYSHEGEIKSCSTI